MYTSIALHNASNAVLEYANFAKKHKDASKIFVIEYDAEILEALTGKVSSIKAEDDLPYMFIVNEKSVSTKYNTASKIANALEEAKHSHNHE